MIIDCKKIANRIYQEIKKELSNFINKGIKPKIVIIHLNNNPASNKYVNRKVLQAETIGVNCQVVSHLKNQEELILYLKKLNSDKTVHGYIVQLPLPDGFQKEKIFENIAIEKDLDGLSSLAISRNLTNSNLFYPLPCTSAGIIKIIKSQKYQIAGKNVVIVNRSDIVGKPLVGMLLRENATVTVCHSKTKNLSKYTNEADILITAIGKPLFFKLRSIKKNAFVIDAGITIINNKLVGDVDTKQVEKQAKYLTTVPNGVGQLTVAMIFKNLVDLIKYQESLK